MISAELKTQLKFWIITSVLTILGTASVMVYSSFKSEAEVWSAVKKEHNRNLQVNRDFNGDIAPQVRDINLKVSFLAEKAGYSETKDPYVKE